MNEPTTSRPILRLRSGTAAIVDDELVVEEPIEIRLGGVAIAVVMRTPGHDEELIRGFALTEGIALAPDEIVGVTDLGEGRHQLEFVPGTAIDPERFRRNLYATSSCGVCGKASIDAVRISARIAPPGPTLPAGLVTGLAATFAQAQPSFDLTGGIHAAAAFTAGGELVASREDIGRHNAVDKLVGAIAGEGWPVPHPILFVSGRVSFEIVQKAAVAGFPIVAGVSAASSLAVDLAAELGMTVLGFVRGEDFNVYTGHQRVETPTSR
jgi:FdhD protein